MKSFMKPSLESIRSQLPELDGRLVHDHLKRLGDIYFKKFTLTEIGTHLQAISRLSPDNPVQTIIYQKRDMSVECTILAFDYPSEFSLIAGILAGTGFNIISGDVYTYERGDKKPGKARYKKKTGLRPTTRDYGFRRKIVDFFSGTLTTPMTFEIWRHEFKKRLRDIVQLLENGEEESVEKAKNRVNEMVVRHLANLHSESAPVLYPVEMVIDHESSPYTRLKVVSEDTPAFLYALSNALSLHGISIEHVRIRTIYGRVEDRIDLLDSQHRKIEDAETLNRIRISVLLIKQFTYFLARAPDPYAAISRFEQIVHDILKQPLKEKWISHLTDPRNLRDIARLLGASDFLWEDFIRLQYESLLPLFDSDPASRVFSKNPETMPARLAEALEKAGTFEEQKKAVNFFKDQEIFFIDLDHILDIEGGFHFLEERLTSLAELIVNAATEAVYNHLVKRYGKPRSVAGLLAPYAVFGLGKLGGAALGYASDIELLFVYRDNGETDGGQQIQNAEFFNMLVKGVFQFIEAKREGIFQVDLRLRPYGSSGPLACSIERFCDYYGKEGKAHSYEKISLVRLRSIGGDREFGKQLERIRDEIVYFSDSIDLKEIRDLREKQYREKNIQGKTNAKFSPGGLVDLEYGVQALQVIYGKDVPALRTPRIQDALNALGDAGVFSEVDAARLVDAYRFLRELINGLRMLRGSAKDLFLPSIDSNEFGHLARRMGYVRKAPIDSAQRLYIDCETHMAVVRVFVEKYFDRESLSAFETGTVVDIILSDNIADKVSYKILLKNGFKKPKRALVNLQALAGKGSRKEVFAKIALLSLDMIKRMPDQDMALNNWDRYINSLVNPEFHYNVLLSQPMHLEILLRLFSSSQFLSDTLIRNPGFFDWLIIPEILHPVRKRRDLEDELRRATDTCSGLMEWLNKLRRFRRREILRIGTRDIYLGVSTKIVMQELSTLSEACTQVALEECLKKVLKDKTSREGIHTLSNQFCILAFGKLGGCELNYSSDIDLLGLYSDPVGVPDGKKGEKEEFTRIMEGVITDLSSHTDEGYSYRVDSRLRPFGSSGELVQNFKSVLAYYENSASLWEIQAAMKLRPIAGNLSLGYEFLNLLRPIIFMSRDRAKITGTIERMRNLAIRASSRLAVCNSLDIKSGVGGIRDIEFLVQGLQLIHGPHDQTLTEGNTMLAIDAIAEANIITEEKANILKDDYIFLRRIEHYLQIMDDQQIHSIPKREEELSSLAKRMLGVEASAGQFMDQVYFCLKRVRDSYNHYLLKK